MFGPVWIQAVQYSLLWAGAVAGYLVTRPVIYRL